MIVLNVGVRLLTCVAALVFIPLTLIPPVTPLIICTPFLIIFLLLRDGQIPDEVSGPMIDAFFEDLSAIANNFTDLSLYIPQDIP